MNALNKSMNTQTLTITNTNGTTLSERGLPHSLDIIDTRLAATPYPDDTRLAIKSLYTYARQNGLSIGKLADLLDRDPSTISKLFSGHYDAENLAPITLHITNFLAESTRPQTDIIARTSVVADVAELCTLAWLKKRICYLFGPTQAGKSVALEHFIHAHPSRSTLTRSDAPRSHAPDGQPRYLEVPAGGSLKQFANKLSITLCLAANSNWADQRRRILDTISPHDLLIIDEFSRCFNPTTGAVRLATLEFIREIWSAKKCGLVLVMTDIARDEMQQGKFHDACAQLWYRGAADLQLERIPPDPDLKVIATAHGLPTPDRDHLARIRQLVASRGMTRYTTLLELANDLAAATKTKPTWANFLQAHDTLSRLARKS